MGLKGISCEDCKWMELAHDQIQLGTLYLALLNLCVLLQHCQLTFLNPIHPGMQYELYPLKAFHTMKWQNELCLCYYLISP
jgi:hypothetical protein